MSIASLPSASSSASGHPARTQLSERIETGALGASATLDNMAQAAVDGVSATVSFSGKALHALEHAGELVVDGAEDLARDAWHGVEAAASAAGHVVDAVETGAHQIASTARSVATQLGHYASIGLHATGEAVSEAASGTVMAASAAGKTLMTVL